MVYQREFMVKKENNLECKILTMNELKFNEKIYLEFV